MNPTVLAVESWLNDHPPEPVIGALLSIKDDHDDTGAAFRPGWPWNVEDVYHAPDEPVMEDDPCGGATC